MWGAPERGERVGRGRGVPGAYSENTLLRVGREFHLILLGGEKEWVLVPLSSVTELLRRNPTRSE